MRLPESRHGIGSDFPIGRENRQSAHHGLADQHPVEGVAMERGQTWQREDRRLIQR